MARYSQSLTTKTTLLLAVISLAALLSVVLPLLHYQEKVSQQTILQGLDGQAMATAHGIDLFLEDGLRDSRAISSTLPEQALSQGRLGEIESHLKRMQEVFPNFGSGFFVLDKQGKLLADYPSHPELRGRSYAFREYYQRTMREKKGVVGQPYWSERTRSPVLTFTAPVRDSHGQIVAIVGGSMDLLSQQSLGGFQQRFGKTGYLYVFDKRRLLLLHPDHDEILTAIETGKNSLLEAALNGFEGGGETVNSKGVPMLVAVRRIPNTDWLAAVQLPRQEAYTPIAKAHTEILEVSSLAIFLVIAIGVVAIRRVSRPLQQLEQVAAQITTDLDKMEITDIFPTAYPVLDRLTNIRSRDEIGRLASSFLKLTTRFHSTFHSLKLTNSQLQEAKEAAVAKANHHEFHHSLIRAIHEVSLDGILAVNDSGIVVSHNQKLLEVLQISLPDIPGNLPDSAMGVPDQPLLSAFVDRVKDPVPFLKRVRELYDDPDANDRCEVELKDGRTLERYSSGLQSEAGQYLGRVWFFRDITARKQTEEARKTSEKVILEWKKRLELAEKAALPLGLWEWDINAGTLEWSDEVYRQLGFPLDQPSCTHSFFSRIHPEDRARVETAFQSVASGLSQTYEVQFRVIRPDGNMCWLDSRGAVVQDGSPRMVGISIDITKLRRFEADYRSMVETAPYGIFRSTVDGRFLAVNPALAKMLSYDRESDLLSLDLERDVYCDSGDRTRLVNRFFETGYLKEVEADWKRKDGCTITVRISAVPVREGSGEIEAIGFIQDVTERKSLTRQFWQAQKMEAIGRLASGVAHDFNNVLMIVNSYAELILERRGTDEKIARYADRIQKSATKAVSVTRQLLAFSRQQLLEPEILDLNTVVAELSKILPNFLGEDIAVITTLEPELHRVKVDRGQMEQVVMNLAVNARDAMPKGGCFEITIQNVELDAAYAAKHAPMNPGPYVKLSVIDTGNGMDAATRLQIFEPFFTTKDRGKGTGLGLAAVYGIVKQSGGSLDVTSEVGRGTTFDVYLPQFREPVTVTARPHVLAGALGGSETILLVEDEAELRDAIWEYLRSRGYTMLVAGDGAEALRACEQHAGAIDVILTDLVMPGMDGIEVAKSVSALFPDIHVLYMSGYSDRAAELLGAGAVLLKKPFSLSDLASKVRAVLEAPSTNGDDITTASLLPS